MPLRYLIVFISVLMVFNSSTVRAVGGVYDETFFQLNGIENYDPRNIRCTVGGVTTDQGTGPTVGQLSVPKDFTLGVDNTRRAIELAKNLMKDYNLTDFQAAGVVGNFMVESGGSHVPPNVNEGGHIGPPAFSGGYGWAQWTGGRQIKFIDYAIANGYMAGKTSAENLKSGVGKLPTTTDLATDAANYAYLNQEFSQTSEGAVIGELKKTKNVTEAANAWERVFERAGIPATAERIKRGEHVLEGLNGSGALSDETGATSTGGATDSSVCANQSGTISNPTNGAVFKTVTFPLVGQKSVVLNPEIFANNTTSQGGHPYIAFDIYAKAGTKVVALTDGVVTNTSYTSDLGQSVSVYNEKTGLVLYYTHMVPSGYAKTGTKINPGDPIGSLASVKNYPSINTDHLHIDASKGKYRVACSRDSCSTEAKSKFVDIGPDLYAAYQKVGG